MIRWLLVFCIFYMACGGPVKIKKRDYDKLGVATDSTYFVLVANPAGSVPNHRYDEDTRHFNKIEEDFEYLLLPFHDVLFGDTLEQGILIGQESIRGELVESKLVGGIAFLQGTERKTLPVFVPVEKNKQTVELNNLSDLLLKYSGLSSIVKTWLINQKGWGEARFEKWLEKEDMQ